MNKKGLIAVCIAVLIPLVCYLVLKQASDTAVVVPRHYLPEKTFDTVIDGKMSSDTVWHTVDDIKLVNQLGDTVHLKDIQGKAIVMDFFFTSCGSICPKMTANMAKMQRSFMDGGDVMKKIEELRSLSSAQLQGELLELRKDQFNLRMKKANGSLEKTHLVRMVRKAIAKIKTLLTEKEGK